MNALVKLASATVLAAALSAPAMSQTVITAPGQSTTGTYMDYMKTVYARATFAELLQIPLTSFDKDFQLTALGAESWSQSDDGLVWTFKLRDGLVWSDGEPLKAEDYVFALQRAATTGYDFAWYWDFAGGIKNWKEVTEGKADVSTLGYQGGRRQDHRGDDRGGEAISAERREPLVPGSKASVRQVRRRLGGQRRHDHFLRAFQGEELGKIQQLGRPSEERHLQGSLAGAGRRLEVDPTLGAPEVGMPAFLAGDADYSYLNAGQIPVAQQQFPEGMRTNAVFATSYISFDLARPPFDNADVRRAMYYAINRPELTSTVLKDIAVRPALYSARLSSGTIRDRRPGRVRSAEGVDHGDDGQGRRDRRDRTRS